MANDLDELGRRLDRIAAMAEAGAGQRQPAAGIEESDTAVHLRLNRIEEALAGMAARLGAGATQSPNQRSASATAEVPSAEVPSAGGTAADATG